MAWSIIAWLVLGGGGIWLMVEARLAGRVATAWGVSLLQSILPSEKFNLYDSLSLRKDSLLKLKNRALPSPTISSLWSSKVPLIR
jgi:hypothetical protein